MDSREDFPRVSVGNIQDWHRIKDDYKNAAITTLNQHLATNNFSAERVALMAHLDQFIDRTFLLAEPNLRINGQNMQSLDISDQDMVIFDEALDRRVWSLADTRLQWHKQIAETRRRFPSDISTLLSNAFPDETVLDTKAVYAIANDSTDDREGIEKDDGLLELSQRIEVELQETSRLGEELDQNIPSQKERAERVKIIGADVKTPKP